MKRLLFVFLILIVLTLVWYGESRRFFCVDNGNCITVWKTYNNVCYIIPGKYYGIIKPSQNFFQSTNTNNLTIFFTNELPNALIYKSDQDLKINNSNKDEFIFYDYNQDVKKFDTILYMPNAKKNNDIKSNASLMDIFIQEDYALNKDG